MNKMHRTAVFKVVAVNGCYDDVLQTHFCDSFCHAARFVSVYACKWFAGGYITERASACAYVAQNHHGCVLFLPAFADIGAAGFLADRYEAFRFHKFTRFSISRRTGRLDADPVRLAQNRCVRTRLLLRVAVFAPGRREINECSHVT